MKLKFKEFFFNDKPTYNFISYIVLGYLAQKVDIQGEIISSGLLVKNLQTIFSFIGDY